MDPKVVDNTQLIAIILLIPFALVVLYCIIRQILSKFDHAKWEKNATPSLDAEIVDVKSKMVRYMKNDAKYRTVVKFSDGFVFITHKTEREEGIVRYSVSIDKSFMEHVILKAAKEAHEKAVHQKLG